LRSALEELRSEDLRFSSDAELDTDLEELEQAAGVLEAEVSRRLAEVDERGSYRREGYLSLSSWLAQRFRMACSAAAQQSHVARALAHMTVTRDALAQGELPRSAVRVLVSARELNPDRFAAAEETLVQAAQNLSSRDLRRAVAYWRQAADPDGAVGDAEQLVQLRRLHVSPTLDGTVRVDGDLDPDTGQTLLTALRSVEDASARASGDRRTSAQRRADALGEICRAWLDSTGRPNVAGERPHVTVTVDLEALEGRAGYRCELEDLGPVTTETARRWACDASVSRVITRGRSEPLDVGRRTSVVSPGLRRAVVIRDRHCQFPGCDRPHAWCDAHHVRHWADGGPTALDNLVLLCRPHHRSVHDALGFRLRMVDGRPQFSQPDGNFLEDRAPP
jgi:uncharacterized protein DUF222/HNH endonuclease